MVNLENRLENRSISSKFPCCQDSVGTLSFLGTKGADSGSSIHCQTPFKLLEKYHLHITTGGCVGLAMSTTRLHFKPKLDKIVELLLYLAHKKPDIDHYRALKMIYLSDREHFNRYGRPITFEKYSAMQWGPVPTKALDIVKEHAEVMRAANIEELPFETLKLDKIIHLTNPKRAVNHDLFSKSDLKIVDEVLHKYGDCTFIQLHNMTKKDFCYRKAWENKRESAKSAPITYEDLLEESPKKEDTLDDLEFISDHV